MKAFRILLLALAVLLLLAGCGAKTIQPQDEGVTVQCLPEKVENAGDLPVLKWLCLADPLYATGYTRIWNGEAVQQLNQMLEELDMPFRLQIILLTRDSKKVPDWMETETVQKLLPEVDLIYGNLTPGQMQQLLAPITEYALGNAQPSLENAVPYASLWSDTTIDGEIYGIRAGKRVAPKVAGWTVSNSTLASCGLTAEDFLGKRFWEMDDVFARVFAGNGGMPFMTCNGGGASESVPSEPYQAAELRMVGVSPLLSGERHEVGSIYALDYSQGAPSVVNYLEIDNVRRYQEAVLRYKDAGYMTDLTYSEKDPVATVSYGNIGTDAVCNDEEFTYIPVGRAYASALLGGDVSGVSATSTHKEEALSLLSLIGENESFRMQLFFGKEGQDYTISKDGYYAMIFHKTDKNKTEISYNLDFLSAWSYYSGMTCDRNGNDFTFAFARSTTHTSEVIPEGKTLLDAHRELTDRAYIRYPYSKVKTDEAVLTFDFTSVMPEVEAVYAALQPYLPDYVNAQEIEDDPDTADVDETRHRMTPEYYDQMLSDIKAAGGDKIQAELQRQLDEWLKANPDWDK